MDGFPLTRHCHLQTVYERLVEREKKCKAAEASVSAALQQREQALDKRQKQVGSAAGALQAVDFGQLGLVKPLSTQEPEAGGLPSTMQEQCHQTPFYIWSQAWHLL